MKNWDHSIHQHVLVYQGKDIRIILFYFCKSNKKVYGFWGLLFFYHPVYMYIYIYITGTSMNVCVYDDSDINTLVDVITV